MTKGSVRRRRVSVRRGAGLAIERLRNLGSDAVARRCVLGKDT